MISIYLHRERKRYRNNSREWNRQIYCGIWNKNHSTAVRIDKSSQPCVSVCASVCVSIPTKLKAKLHDWKPVLQSPQV